MGRFAPVLYGMEDDCKIDGSGDSTAEKDYQYQAA
jgi:hypothetical protein